MSLAANIPPRAPIWNKSLARVIGGAPAKPANGGRALGQALTAPEPAPPKIDEKILTVLGLKAPPSDPRLLTEFLVADDVADAESDADDFSRGIRRAVRLHLALCAGLHRRAGQRWKEWVEKTFKVGYARFNRYHVAATIQVELVSRGLPRLASESQSRAIASLRRHEKIWETLGSEGFKNGLPDGNELKARLRKMLGVETLEVTSTGRIKLHRYLLRGTHIASDDSNPLVAEAHALLRQAIRILEKGGTL